MFDSQMNEKKIQDANNIKDVEQLDKLRKQVEVLEWLLAHEKFKSSKLEELCLILK